MKTSARQEVDLEYRADGYEWECPGCGAFHREKYPDPHDPDAPWVYCEPCDREYEVAGIVG